MFTAALVRAAQRKGQVSASRKVGTTRYVHIKKRFSATAGHGPGQGSTTDFENQESTSYVTAFPRRPEQ